MENSYIPKGDLENRVYSFIRFSMELRSIIKHENRMMLQVSQYQNSDLALKKLEMLKHFSAEAPVVMEITHKGEALTGYLNKMLFNVLKDVRYHLNLNTSYQLLSMKRCMEQIERRDNIKYFLSDQVEYGPEGRGSCH